MESPIKLTSLADKLLAKFDGQDILSDLRIYGVYTGNFADPLNNFGAAGFLPLAGNSMGDSLGLVPIIGQSSDKWPVMKFDHNGGAAQIISSSLSLFPVGAMLMSIRPSYIFDDKDEFIESKKEILAFSKLLGDAKETKTFIKYLEGLKEEDEPYPGVYLYQKGEGRTWLVEFLEAFHKIYIADNDPIKLWSEYLKKYPFVIPAYELLANAQIKNKKDAFDAAWKARTSEYFFSDCIFELGRQNAMEFDFDTSDSKNYDYLFEDNAKIELSQYIVKSGKGKSLPQFAAIKAMAEEEDCGKKWDKAGAELLKAGKIHEAYCSFVNAINAHYEESSEVNLESVKGAAKAAKALKEETLTYIWDAVLDQL